MQPALFVDFSRVTPSEGSLGAADGSDPAGAANRMAVDTGFHAMPEVRGILNPRLSKSWLLKNSTGRGVRVAVIDSGMDANHPRLRGRVAQACIVRDNGKTVSCEEVPPDASEDSYGHGTGVAGIILEVAPQVELVSVKVLGPDNTGTGEALIAGLEWALTQKIKLINMSLATSKEKFFSPLYRLCEQAYYQDAVLVVSKRNWGDLGMPAQFSSVVSVDLVSTPDKYYLQFMPNQIIPFAARGQDVEVPCPGGAVRLQTGTSFATPHVTGLCALLLSRFPSLLPYEVKAVLARFGRERSEKNSQQGGGLPHVAIGIA